MWKQSSTRTMPPTRREAIARLWPEGATVAADGPALVEAVFRNALHRWFGVLFWFLLLGPVGALLYRLAAFSAEGAFARTLPPTTLAGARSLHAVLDWPVAQLMTLSMALVGNFDAVFTAWREARGNRWQLDSAFLGAAARASVAASWPKKPRNTPRKAWSRPCANCPNCAMR